MLLCERPLRTAEGVWRVRVKTEFVGLEGSSHRLNLELLSAVCPSKAHESSRGRQRQAEAGRDAHSGLTLKKSDGSSLQNATFRPKWGGEHACGYHHMEGPSLSPDLDVYLCANKIKQRL